MRLEEEQTRRGSAASRSTSDPHDSSAFAGSTLEQLTCPLLFKIAEAFGYTRQIASLDQQKVAYEEVTDGSIAIGNSVYTVMFVSVLQLVEDKQDRHGSLACRNKTGLCEGDIYPREKFSCVRLCGKHLTSGQSLVGTWDMACD